MDLDYTGKKCVKISMIKDVDKCIKDFPEIVTNKAATPASDHLFDISENDPGKLLPQKQAQDFHHSVAQLLFLCMRARPDLKTAVSFLTT